MAQATFTFPRGFLWGTATAAHQNEGDNRNNDWWLWEGEPGRITQGQRSGLGCDWWGGRWQEDFDRAAQAGQNSHRLSIEWSRIEPSPGAWDEDALDHYRQMLQGLHQRGMQPLVTLHHFTNPIWLLEAGSWENPEVVGRFERYVRKAVERLGDLCQRWCTINEPNVYAYFAYSMGAFPPGKRNVNFAFAAMRQLIKAHAAAYHAIHSIQPAAQVGIVMHYRSLVPKWAGFPLDAWAAGLQSFTFNDVIPMALHDGRIRFPVGREAVPAAARTLDFLGINYYTEEQVYFDPTNVNELFGTRRLPPGIPQSDTGWIAVCPEGMYRALKWGRRFGVPIVVTENGIENKDDSLRPAYLISHLHQLWRAVNFNWKVLGYFHWTLVDNFEWNWGWTQRFGLWQLDVETQVRTPRPSAGLYAEICRSNRLSSEMVERYAPQLMPQLFPG